MLQQARNVATTEGDVSDGVTTLGCLSIGAH